ncbi:MAG TPA: glycosyltransferase [Phycisphaerae bacterium]|nr:glycosyltransferase [Phycisphaerae bacterium]
MTAVVAGNPSPLLAGNLAALHRAQPLVAALLESAKLPDDLTSVTGRDGTPTFSWHENEGSRQWLGRTTMPTIRAEALLDSFQPGNGNVLFYCFGHGVEARRLLDSLAPHQAVFIIEPEPAKFRLALEVRDFSEDFRSGRLLAFTGQAAWKECGDFLVEHAGYVPPTRILSWPWFDRQTIDHATTELTALQGDVARRRAESCPRKTSSGLEPVAGVMAARVMILSTNTNSESLRLARRLEAGVRARGFPCLAYIPDSPKTVAPAGATRLMEEAAPTHLIAVDAYPEALWRGESEIPIAVILSRHQPPPPNTKSRCCHSYFVFGESDRAALIRAGISRQHVHLLQPAVLPNLACSGGGDSILVLADCLDYAAAATGLHLTSHVRLWDAAAQFIRANIDDYHDEMADSALAAAEKRLNFKLQDPGVRGGLIERIRSLLAPQLIREAYVGAMQKAGLKFRAFGRSWRNGDADPEIEGSPPWSIEAADKTFAAFGAIVVLKSSDTVTLDFLDGLGTGLPGFIRRSANLSSLFCELPELDKSIERFSSPADLVRRLQKFVLDSTPFRIRSASASAYFRTSHTWSHRIDQILSILEKADVETTNTNAVPADELTLKPSLPFGPTPEVPR